MDWITSKNAVLSVLTCLTLGGCATATPLTDRSSDPNTPDIAATSDATRAEKPKTTESHTDIWARIRHGFAMPKLDSPLVAVHAQWFANNPEYMGRMTGRSRLYLHHIVDEIEKRGLPMELALLPAIESAYQPYAASHAKAVGLWQFIPPTGRLYGLKMNWWYDGRRDVEASTQAALDYLEKLHKEFNGDWHLALAAYNAGEGKIGRMMEYNRQRGKPTDYQSLKLKRETINYVPKLMAMANIVADPEKYGVQLADIPNAPYFTRVATGSQIDLGVAARLTNVSIDDLQVINPAFTRWATDPDGPHHLLVPVDKKDALMEGLSKLTEEERVQWRGHEVRQGDTLHDVARRYGVSIEVIRTANRLTTNLLRTGQSLLIPVSTRPLQPAVIPVVAAPATTAAHGQPVIHQVRSGETLYSIARRYNVLVHQLAQWNLLDQKDMLRLGQRLKIWPRGTPAALYKDTQVAAETGG
jgi:membrane-bound lytic murein transglycosylase D